MGASAVAGEVFVHPTAIVEPDAEVGAGTRVWHHSHVRAGSRIGRGCTLGFCVYVDRGAVVGDRCKLQNHVSVYQGVVLEDDVFAGPGATFTNDRFPRANPEHWEVVPTLVGQGASLGAGAVVVCGVVLGPWSMAAAGAVVTRDVPPHALVAGNPARHMGWVCRCGAKLARVGAPLPAACDRCGRSTAGVPA